MASIRQLAPAGLALLAACGHVVDPPAPSARLAMVEATLIAGETVSTLRVGWLDRREPGFVIPAPPETVDLVLSDDGTGASARLVPHPANDSLYLASLPIRPGGRYRLEGRLDTEVIHAATVVPAGFAIETPSTDTLVVSPEGADDFTATIDYRWTAPGATAFVVDSAWFPPGYQATRAPIGQFVILRRQPGSPDRTLRIMAVNRDVDEYLYRTPSPSSNVEGGFGVLGGAIVLERTVVTR